MLETPWNGNLRRTALLTLAFLFLPGFVLQAEELKTLTARSIDLKIPASWNSSPPTSRMRAAQASVPATEAGGDEAELVVFYFGGPTGGIKANIDRWIGQFKTAGRKLDMRQGDCDAGSYIWVDLAGTWKKPDGPPFARKTVDAPNSRVINVILTEKKDGGNDYYFLKLSGPDALVKSQSEALKTAFGADLDSEKPFQLDDAAN